MYVTQPSLAPLPEFVSYLERIWRTGIMTHNGPLMLELEEELAQYLGVDDVVCLANGTCALQLALRALDLTGEVITTPFTFIATASIIAWERCTPVFVDIDPETWNIDPDAIEARITANTTAILPVHVFSTPCEITRIEQIADRHGLKVIYDAAHAMAVNYQGGPVVSRGDVSCLSFHATKLLNTCEGGACVTKDPAIAARIRRMRFFGFDPKKDIVDEGMNAKMTEISAALGLANLRHLDAVRANRRRKHDLYRSLLGNCDFLTFQKIDPDEYNYSYMPVLFDSEDRLLQTLERLAERRIYPRRYFHPSLETVPIFKSEPLPVSQDVARRIACLPLYNTLPDETIHDIASLIGAGRP